MRPFNIPSTPPTTGKCVRFPNDGIELAEAAIIGKDCTFSAFVIEAVRVALDNLQEAEKESRYKNCRLFRVGTNGSFYKSRHSTSGRKTAGIKFITLYLVMPIMLREIAIKRSEPTAEIMATVTVESNGSRTVPSRAMPP